MVQQFRIQDHVIKKMIYIAKRIIVIALLNFCFVCGVKSQAIPALVKDFVKDLSDDKVAYKEIINRHICSFSKSDKKASIEEILVKQLEERRRQADLLQRRLARIEEALGLPPLVNEL